MVGWQYPMYPVLAVAYMQATQFLAVKSLKTMPVESPNSPIYCFIFLCFFSRMSPMMISTASIGQGRPGLLLGGLPKSKQGEKLEI